MTAFTALHRHRPPERWTYGDIAAKVGVDLGIPPDDEQRALLDMIYAEKAPGRPAAFEVCVIGPRQNIKTSTLGVAALADLFVFGVKKHLWSAHLDDTAKNTYVDFKEWLSRSPDYASQVTFYEGHQDRSIVHTETKARIDFGSRTGKGKRGLTGVMRVTLDEALYLQPEHMGAIYPTMLTRPGAQVRLASSAGLVSSSQLRAIRDRGRAGKDNRLAYVEYGAVMHPCEDERCLHLVGTPGCAYDDRDLWWQANCALWPGRIEEESLEDQRNSLPPEEWAREFLSQWEDPASLGGAFSPDQWTECHDESLTQPERIEYVGMAGTPDGMYGSIGVAVETDGALSVAPVDRRRGQRWLVDEAARIQKAHACKIVAAEKGPLEYLGRDLADAGVDVTWVESSSWSEACEDFWQKVTEGQVSHTGDLGLTTSVLGAAWRTVGDRRVFNRKKSDISMLEAVALASHVALSGTESVYESRGVLTL